MRSGTPSPTMSSTSTGCIGHPDVDGFCSFRWWNEHRDRLLFRSAAARDAWQEQCLRRVLVAHRAGPLPTLPVISSMPAPTARSDSDATIMTSGTLSSYRRAYFYQRPQFDVIQAHHWWRIERELGLERPGVVVGFAYNPLYIQRRGRSYQVNRQERLITRRLDRPGDCFYGPTIRRSVGAHNTFYEWQYTRYTTNRAWRKAWRYIQTLRPKLVQMIPSQLQTAWPAVARQPLCCPVIMTSEMLDDVTRGMAEWLFSRVVDKMRCWDGGLGFFECAAGRKHVYDELAYVEKVDGRLVSTDFFNFVHPFLRYANDDDATLDDGLCACGIYGRYFVRFHGRVCQRIVLSCRLVDGRTVTEDVMRFLTYGYLPSARASEELRRRYPDHLFGTTHVRWQLYQRPDGDFEFRYAGDLTFAQLVYLDMAVRFIVLRQGLPAGALDHAIPDQRLALVRHDGLDDQLKNLSVVSDYA